MSDKLYVLLILGMIFLFIGLCIWKKDRDQFKMLEDRLKKKEKSLYQLYESLEEVMNEMECAISQKYVEDKEREEYEYNEYNEDSEYHEHDIENMVIRLKNDGNADEEIAKRLGIGKGEVKLLLDLKKQ